MNKIILTIGLAFISVMAFSQDFDKITSAFGNGNVSELVPLLAATVDISIDDEVLKLGRSDAKARLRTFFLNHSPSSMKVVHKGVSKNDVHYMISALQTNDATFRVTVYIHKNGQEYLIQSLEIEKE
jgi:hypothetical protein